MKQYINVYFVLSLLLGFLISCNEDRNNVTSEGYLYLGVEEDNTTVTRADKPVTDEKLRVDIMSASGDTVKSYTDYLREVKGQKLIIPAGSYKVVVSSNENGGAAWESPFYAGETEDPIVVKSGEITNTSIICKIANTKVTVTYSESLKKAFIDYCDTVSTSAGKLVYTRDEYRAGYFTSEGNLTAKLYLKNKDGNEFTLQRIVKDIKPQYHYNLIYSLDDGDGEEAGSDFDLSVDPTDPTEINCNISIKQEDLFGKGEPVLTLTGFENGILSYRPFIDGIQQDIPDASLVLKVPAGIQSVTVKASSSQFEDLPLFDLISWEQAVSKGFPIIYSNQTEQVLDFKGLLSKLEPDKKNTTKHTFVINVLDQLNQEKEITFSFEIKADVKVTTNKPIIWSTFAIIKGQAGNLDNVSFVLREANGVDISITSVTKQEQDGQFWALITGLKPGVEYEYYAVSGTDSNVDFPVSFSISIPSEIPNLGFESWTTLNGTVTNIPVLGSKTVNYVSPNQSSTSLYWDSGNMGAAVASEKITEETTDVAMPSSIKAAKLSSKYPNQLGIGAFAAGSVFSGSAKSVTGSGATLEYGREHLGFPTHMRGYYKYAPGEINYYNEQCPENVNKKTDQCYIYLALATEPITVVSTTSSIIPFSKDNPKVFAYGELISSEKSEEYVPFDITLLYKDNIPENINKAYIIIVATSSRYGDYFTGSTSSVMYIDEFSVGYDFDINCLKGSVFKQMSPININEINNK